MKQLKDDVLANLARTSNVAQFLSVRADSPKVLRHLCVRGIMGGMVSIEDAIRKLVKESVDSMVNVRTFSDSPSKGGEFLMGLKNVDEVLAAVTKFTKAGISVIVNESINIHDGGVSGVWFGDSIEFAPDDTPRCVEKAGVCRLPRKIGEEIIQTIYGVALPAGFEQEDRVEFSVHPRRHGVQHSQFIIWEVERQQALGVEGKRQISWPNRFSQHIGDKTFGLLVANSLGYNVPRSTVISRRVRPFVFGESTGTNEFWYRTAPRRQLPGKLPTVLGHQDLFTLLDSVEGKDRDALASVLVQESVDSQFSGGAALRKSGEPVVEGVIGHGDQFMLGKSSPTSLPDDVFAKVQKVLIDIASSLGPCRMEWVFDGNKVWIVQLHVGAISSDPIRIVDGNADLWIDFHVSEGLEALRQLLSVSNLEGIGIRIIGDVGVTSHFGDLLRGSGIPSMIIKDPVS
jgi:hypothetical protein